MAQSASVMAARAVRIENTSSIFFVVLVVIKKSSAPVVPAAARSGIAVAVRPGKTHIICRSVAGGTTVGVGT